MSQTPTRWYLRQGVVLTTLLVAYPVGLALLYKSPRPRRFDKRLTALLFFGVFAFQCYIAIGMGPSGVKTSVRRTILWWHDQRVSRQRAAQGHATPAADPSDRIEMSHDAWPGFRGVQRDGVVPDGKHQLPWPAEGPPLLWERLVGSGHGSVAVVDDRLYTLEQRAGDEAVTCFDLQTGDELWAYRYPASFEESMGGPGPRSTPTLSRNWLFALGGTGILNCLDPRTGDLIWTRNILDDADARNLYFGMAASPWLDSGLVYVVAGGPNASVIAYRADSGEIEWTAGEHAAGYASPIIANVHGSPQLIVFDGAGLSAYNPRDGQSLWHFPWKTDFGVNASQPMVLDNNRFFISSGYGTGCALVRIDAVDEGFSAHEVWANRNLKMRYVCAVNLGNAVVGADDKVLVCLDLETGERLWKKGRYGECQILLAEPYLVIQCEDGDIALIEASSKELKEVSRVPALNRKTVQPPVIAKGRLFVRNDRSMKCYDLRAPKAAVQE